MKTLSTGDSVIKAYLKEIGRVPLLTASQEIDLSRKVQRAYALKALERPLTKAERREVKLGERAERKFVHSNLRLVVTCAKKYAPVTKSLDIMDLIQEGNLGLIRAVQGFDPAKGCRFTTFAFWWIRQGITRAIVTKDRTIKMPFKLSEMAANWNVRTDKMRARLGRCPTHEELAEAYKLSVHELRLCLERSQSLMSLDMTTRDDGTPLGDLLSGDIAEEGPLHKLMLEEEFTDVSTVLLGLTERERDIVLRRLGMNGHHEHTLTEMSKLYGISRERVRQIHDRAVNRIRLRLARAEREADLAEPQSLLAG